MFREWIKERFYPRNLIALSSKPMLVYPTHYVGDEGYISDTEDTLSHEGESVKHFREKVKELEMTRNKATPPNAEN